MGRRGFCAVVGAGAVVVVVLVAVTISLFLIGKQQLQQDPRYTESGGTVAEADYGWGEWAEWGPCSVTCGRGGGVKIRRRECLQHCSGPSRDVTQCGDVQCPAPVRPQWSSWGPWSSCSVTCGSGSQNRQRSCDSSSKCPGDSRQHRDCPGWKCPDCSESCPGGGRWNTACTRCECAGKMITGRVLSTQNTPQANVDISPAQAPYDVITTTDATGAFSIPSVCPGLTLLFQKQGFVEQQYSASTTAAPILINLERLEPLSMLTQPQSKSRLVGESVVLCCGASGNPPPSYYEWFKDDELLQVDMTAEHSNLTLEELMVEDAGEYRCRANNDFTAIYSQQVTLHIQDNPDDFCFPYPASHVLKLPRGCKSPGGDDVYDVGTCQNRQCRYWPDKQSIACTDEEEEEEKFCCGPTGYSRVDLVCEEGEDFVFVVAGCGCGKCIREHARVKGRLQALDTSDPIPYGKIQATGGDRTWADSQGQFSITIPPGHRRLVLKATDLDGAFVETMKIIDATQKVPYTVIRLQRKAVPVSFDASEGSVLNMGGGKGTEEAFAGIRIPPNSVFASDGTVYTGMVRASLNVIDPRNADDVINAPGDLTFVDEEGQEQPLKTYGMFYLQLNDDAGNPLQAEGGVEITLDTVALGYSEFNETPPSIWVLDSAGHWNEVATMKREQGSVRQKREANVILIGNVSVPVTEVIVNIDKRYGKEFCFAKVRVFKTNEFISLVSDVTPVIIATANGTWELYRWQTVNNNPNFCVSHPCDVNKTSGFRGSIFVEYGRNEMRAIPVKYSSVKDRGIDDEQLRAKISYENLGNAISVDLSYKKQQPNNGPFYTAKWWNWSNDCSNASPEENHFRFYQRDVKTLFCNPDKNYTRLERGSPNKTDYFNLYAWYTNDLIHEKSMKAHTVMFIKVITNSTRPILVRADSKVGETRGSVKKGDRYGFREGCATADTGVLCLEVKPSGYVSCTFGPGQYNDYTWLEVQHANKTDRKRCSGFSINNHLSKYLTYNKSDNESENRFEMSIGADFLQYGTYLTGVYRYTGDSTHELEDIKDEAHATCMAGINPTKGATSGGHGVSNDNYALEFFCDD